MITVVRRMGHADLEDVIAIHLAAFPAFFLSFLGPAFLRELYREVISEGVALVGSIDSKIEGFVVGVVDSRSFYRRLLRRKFVPIALALAPVILRRPSTLTRVWTRVCRTTGQGESAQGAELMSLAVHPRSQRHGVGRELVEAFAQAVHEQGAERLWLTTDGAGNESAKQFYEALHFTKRRSFTTSEGRLLEEYAR